MREPSEQQGNNIPFELRSLYQRIDCNAKTFGMSPAEVAAIKKECKIAFQHKKVLDKLEQKRQK